MLVMSVIAIVCVVGVVGALVSTLNYDQLYGHSARDYQPPRSVRRARSRRRSRQLRAVEAALAAERVQAPGAEVSPARHS
jgi:hypothetical protein